MLYEIEILNDAMVLLDADGNSYECHSLTTNRAAKRALQDWIRRYTINVADAYRVLEAQFSA